MAISEKHFKMFTCIHIVLLVINAVFGKNHNGAKMRFYQGSFYNYAELPLANATDIFSTNWYNHNRTTVILCHGFTGKPNGTAVTFIINAYLDKGESNVALLNWEHLAADIYNNPIISYLFSAMHNAIKLGDKFAGTLLSLRNGGMDLSNTHLIGHSLGAHVMGIAGNKMANNGAKMPRITGLDPAGNIFDFKPPQYRLNPNSADFVDVIHSDYNKYGSKISLGTVDFWPNYKDDGYVIQPGCDDLHHSSFSDKDLCNHFACFRYMIDDIMKHPGTVLGSYATNYRTWSTYTEQQSKAIVLEMGKYDLNATPGNYFLRTNASGVSPYGLGVHGLYHN